MKYVSFDTETTGLDHEKCRIIELAAEVFDENYNIIDRMDTFIKLPEKENLPERITEITNITDEMLLTEGVEEVVAAKCFAEMINGDDVTIIAHNACFDIAFVMDMFNRSYPQAVKLLEKANYIDTLTISKDRKLYPHKLQDMIDHYGLEAQNSHRAIDDAHAVTVLFKALRAEKDDISEYINVFGYNPKYGVYARTLEKITYASQPYRTVGQINVNLKMKN